MLSSSLSAASIVCDNLDIKKLNNQLRKLALEGKNMLKNKKKCTKFNCSKEILKGVSLTCMYCQSLAHKDCISSLVADDNRFRCETCLMNDVRSMQPVESVDANILKLVSLIIRTAMPKPSQMTPQISLVSFVRKRSRQKQS